MIGIIIIKNANSRSTEEGWNNLKRKKRVPTRQLIPARLPLTRVIFCPGFCNLLSEGGIRS